MRFLPFLLSALSVALGARVPSPLPQPLSLHLSHVNHQQHPSPDVPAVPPEFNINSGGPASGRFIAEHPQWLVGKTDLYVDHNAVIGGAEPKNLLMYKSHRFGVASTAWGYDIPVMEPGLYDCTIHFADTHTEAFSEGARVFNLTIATNHGQPHVFPDIDIYKQLNGAHFTVLTKTLVDLIIPGYLYIRVEPSAGDAIISGITCERTADLPNGIDPDYSVDPNIPVIAVGDTDKSNDPANPSGATIVGTEININVGGPQIGRFVAEDYAWIFGTTSFWDGPDAVVIGGAEEKNAPALMSQRYGLDGSTWGYRIPVQLPGLYACSLHFAETDSASFEVGARVFNIQVQHSAMENVDVYSESGEAPFTSVVKTFLDLQVAYELYIELSAVTGDAFLSAITCEKTGELTSEEIAKFLPPRVASQSPELQELTPSAAPQVSPSLFSTPESAESPGVLGETPIIGSPIAETPMPDTIVSKTPTAATPSDGILVAEPPPGSGPSAESPVAHTPLTGSPVLLAASPVVEIPAMETPFGETPAATPVSQTSIPEGEAENIMPSTVPLINIEGSPSGVDKEGMSASSSPTVDSSSSPSPIPSVSPIPLDEKLTVNEGEEEQVYELLGTVTDGGRFTVGMKDALITLSRKSTEEPSRWAMISLQERVRPTDARLLSLFTARQDVNRVYEIDLQAVHKSSADEITVVSDYTGYINNDVDEDLKERGINNFDVTWRDEPFLTSASPTDLNNTPTVVGIVVGCILAFLILIACAAFFLVRRSRSGASAFDGPPPVTESEMSSVMERSETAASIEYLDDDSTFTAATSRAGDHVDQVAIDEDIFGRGNVPASAHGTS